MTEWARLIDSLAGLVTAVAWPVTAVMVARFLAGRHRAAFERLLDRVTAVSYPGGQIDLAVAEQEAQVEELAGRLAGAGTDPAERLRMVRRAVERAEHLGRLREATWWGGRYLEESGMARRVRQAVRTDPGHRPP
ncbi:hypothetical protein AB0K12_03475 [Nonomuraea sp. NPDC049419]|uniref:hypothetical protein n=1 Tax=Nonomuraea sp. NPDC049419 TaxID=3155772 RepID=UPI003428E7C0